MNMAAQIIVALYSCGHAMDFDVTVCILCHILMSLFKCDVIYQTNYDCTCWLHGTQKNFTVFIALCSLKALSAGSRKWPQVVYTRSTVQLQPLSTWDCPPVSKSVC